MPQRRFVIEEISTQMLKTNPYNNRATKLFSKEEADKHFLEYGRVDFTIYELADVSFITTIK